MTVEIERKFLVADTGCLADLEGERLSQGYIASTGRATVRVRICGARAWLTLKGRTEGLSRREFEYSVDVLGTENVLQACRAAGVRKIVVSSSGAAYGYHADNPEWLSEDDPVPVSYTHLTLPTNREV